MNNTVKTILIAVVIAALAIFGLAALTAPDERTVGEKVGDSVDTLSEGEGLDDAAREFEDRTTMERMGDSIEETTDEAVENINEAADNAAENIEEAYEDAKDSMSDAADEAEEESREFSEESEQELETNDTSAQ